ncbi:hypothetical protein H4R33_001121 [Dimargaris cristalligena]|uniref:Uncharacterized protein n=1 Tax=Dimargaris cristalligena TaxID=215637 RepID=A0A4P9ZSJ2_9FUNG|nr:hypothetical protein H4R33_001121 [Dimargaris cristalligena]RKP36453.1 hypothetical protein BJ085DRAFT_39041 [Dimargaris cristalligena]|eukprot:RKP36453.1 hypothetical protein BJ085DRAFT_39041 [Dimargaris cristalligena]
MWQSILKCRTLILAILATQTLRMAQVQADPMITLDPSAGPDALFPYGYGMIKLPPAAGGPTTSPPEVEAWAPNGPCPFTPGTDHSASWRQPAGSARHPASCADITASDSGSDHEYSSQNPGDFTPTTPTPTPTSSSNPSQNRRPVVNLLVIDLDLDSHLRGGVRVDLNLLGLLSFRVQTFSVFGYDADQTLIYSRSYSGIFLHIGGMEVIKVNLGSCQGLNLHTVVVVLESGGKRYVGKKQLDQDYSEHPQLRAFMGNSEVDKH